MDHEVTTVFIVDDQPVFRLGLRTALDQAEDISVLGETALTEEAVDLVCSFQPRVRAGGDSPATTQRPGPMQAYQSAGPRPAGHPDDPH